MGLIETLGLPVEHEQEIINSAVAQLKRSRNAALAQRNMKAPDKDLDGEEFLKAHFAAVLGSMWKQNVSARAMAEVDAKLKK